MDTMTLGSYTFWRNPNRFTIPKQERHTAVVQTYANIAFFSWGLFYGQTVVLEWDILAESAFDSLQGLLEDDIEIEWDPQTGTTYDVEVIRLDGIYVESALEDAPYRRDVKLELLIKGTA